MAWFTSQRMSSGASRRTWLVTSKGPNLMAEVALEDMALEVNTVASDRDIVKNAMIAEVGLESNCVPRSG